MFYHSYYVDAVPSEPTHIVANLPHGDRNHLLLESNDQNEILHMPIMSYSHPSQGLGAYAELIESVKRKGWKSKIFMETGPASKPQVEKIIPQGVKRKYFSKEGYSVTCITLA